AAAASARIPSPRAGAAATAPRAAARAALYRACFLHPAPVLRRAAVERRASPSRHGELARRRPGAVPGRVAAPSPPRPRGAPPQRSSCAREAPEMSAMPRRRIPEEAPDSTAALLRELVAHLREKRDELREEWVRRIIESRLLTAMSREEIVAEATSVYDNYVEVLETGSVEALQTYARNLSERIIPRGVETDEVLGMVLLLRDVLARSLFEKYQSNFDLLNAVLDAYEPAANRIANTVAISFVQERERVIRQQQEAIRELSTPVLQVREQLLILPIIGVLDSQRARQLTEQLLRAIRDNRAKVAVIDITGVP